MVEAESDGCVRVVREMISNVMLWSFRKLHLFVRW